MSNLRIDVDPTQLGRAALLLTSVSTRLPSTGQFSVPKRNFGPFLGGNGDALFAGGTPLASGGLIFRTVNTSRQIQFGLKFLF